MNPFPGAGKWRVMSQERPCWRKHSWAKLCLCTLWSSLHSLPCWSSWFQVWPELMKNFWTFSYNLLFLEFLIFVDTLVIWIHLLEISSTKIEQWFMLWDITYILQLHTDVKFQCHNYFPKVCRHIFVVFYNWLLQRPSLRWADLYASVGKLSFSLLVWIVLCF